MEYDNDKLMAAAPDLLDAALALLDIRYDVGRNDETLAVLIQTAEAVNKALDSTSVESIPNDEWQDLTTAEIKVLWNQTKKPSEFAKLIMAKLKERNYG